MERWFFSPRRHVPAAVARGDAARLLGPRALERAARERGAVPHGRAAAAAAGRGARRELGPHRRQGRHLAALRPLRRPEPRDGGRPAPLPRDRAGARSRHRLAADRPLPPHAGRAPSTTRCCAATGSTPGARSSLVAREHAEQRAVRGAVRRAPRRVVGQSLARAPAAPLPAAPARHALAGALRGRSRARRRRRAGGELLGPRGARDAAPARGRRRLQRGHDPARRARGRPAGRLRPLRRGSAARASRGRRRTSSASTTRSSRPPAPSIAPSASRRSSPGSSARSRSRTSSLRSGGGPSSRSSARSTAARPSASSTRWPRSSGSRAR